MNIDEILDSGTRTVKLQDQVVTLDIKALAFNEASLAKFQENCSLWYDYFGQKLAEAREEHERTAAKHEVIYATKLVEFKEAGCTDKVAESSAKKDAEVEKARLAVITAKSNVEKIQQHLRAWDKAHENAANRGHTLRKELDKLCTDFGKKSDLEMRLDDIIGS